MLTRPDAAAIAAACARLAAGGGAGALASVARRRGSLPMSGTAKLLVTADGRRTGTVGGGCVEAEVVERALSAAATRRPALSEHTLNAELAGDYGLTCGGTAVIFLEPVYPDPLLARVHAACADLAARGGRGVVATALDWSAGPAKALLPGVNLFHAGTALDPGGRVRTAGGRVLGVTALGDDLADARSRAYEAAGLVRFGGVHYRRDIAAVPA